MEKIESKWIQCLNPNRFRGEPALLWWTNPNFDFKPLIAMLFNSNTKARELGEFHQHTDLTGHCGLDKLTSYLTQADWGNPTIEHPVNIPDNDNDPDKATLKQTIIAPSRKTR